MFAFTSHIEDIMLPFSETLTCPAGAVMYEYNKESVDLVSITVDPDNSLENVTAALLKPSSGLTSESETAITWRLSPVPRQSNLLISLVTENAESIRVNIDDVEIDYSEVSCTCTILHNDIVNDKNCQYNKRNLFVYLQVSSSLETYSVIFSGIDLNVLIHNVTVYVVPAAEQAVTIKDLYVQECTYPVGKYCNVPYFEPLLSDIGSSDKPVQNEFLTLM